MRSSQLSVETILADMKSAIDAGKFIPVNRRKNIATLSDLGLLWSDVRLEIYSLTYNEYISGPDPDWDRPSTDTFWKFKKMVNGNLIYIKFKVEYQVDGAVKVVSFHFDD